MNDPGSLGLAISAESSVEEVRRALAAESGAGLSADELVLASEIAYRARDLATAVQAMRLVVAREPGEAQLHHRLASMLFEAGDGAAAEEQATRALACDPEFEASYHLLVHLKNVNGDIAGAMDVLRAQARHCGTTPALQLNLASLLVRDGKLGEALAAVRVVNDQGSPTEATLMLESELAYQLKQTHAAAAAAERATRLWPQSVEAHARLARVLGALGHHELAVPALRRARELSPDDAALRHLLSNALTSLGQHREALDAIIDAMRLEPGNAEYIHFAAAISDRLGEYDQALQYMRQAIAAAPDRAALHVELAHMLGRARRHGEAVEALEAAERLSPGDADIRDLKLFFLAHEPKRYVTELAHAAGTFPPMPVAPSRRAGRRRRSPLSVFLERAATQVRVLAALVRRDFRYRTVHSRFGILSIFVPQALQIATLGIVLSLFNDGRPPIGDHLFFFYATGVMPFYLFIHVIDHSQNLFTDNISVLQIAVIRRLDLVFANALTELLIAVATVVVTFGVFGLLSYGPASDNHIQAVCAMLAVWLFALGLGLISAVMNNLYRPWLNAWLIVQRFLYIASGVFFIPQSMPGWVRDILVWNPLLQCIEWFRTGFFSYYEPPWLDKPYILGIGFATVVTGLILERALRNRMRMQ